LRQNRLAKMLDLDETILSKIVNGFREPSAELQNRIAEALQCDSAWLFETSAPGQNNNPAAKSKSATEM